jgi:hypothetical protein
MDCRPQWGIDFRMTLERIQLVPYRACGWTGQWHLYQWMQLKPQMAASSRAVISKHCLAKPRHPSCLRPPDPSPLLCQVRHACRLQFISSTTVLLGTIFRHQSHKQRQTDIAVNVNQEVQDDTGSSKIEWLGMSWTLVYLTMHFAPY